MARGRPKAELMLSKAEHAQLSSIARSRSMSSALTQRAQIVLPLCGGRIQSRPSTTHGAHGRDRGRVAAALSALSHPRAVR